jgi:hypothetical protein
LQADSWRQKPFYYVLHVRKTGLCVRGGTFQSKESRLII